ncbi:MAG: GNAT family N-acetyltransferase [bacterium]|nr:GNAT family N-acetyltransferase [bacterium]
MNSDNSPVALRVISPERLVRDMRKILVETERLLIRRPEEGGRRCYERLFCDPVMMRHLGSVWPSEQVQEALAEWREVWGSDNRWYGTLLLKDTLEPIGAAGIRNSGPVGDDLGAKSAGAEPRCEVIR